MKVHYHIVQTADLKNQNNTLTQNIPDYLQFICACDQQNSFLFNTDVTPNLSILAVTLGFVFSSDI